MKTKAVIVVRHDPNWPQEFAKIRDSLVILRHDIFAIEHIGSTSVEGLSAKPIIDIDVVIDQQRFDAVKVLLESIGYRHEGDLGITGREAFKYDNKPDLMKHHLYVCDQTSTELIRHLAFRDWLRTHPDDREWYDRVKRDMARRYPFDIDSYMAGKQPCILAIYEKCGL